MIPLLNSGNRLAAKDYVTENYAPSFLRTPLEEHLNFISWAHDLTQGVEFVGIEEAKETDAIVRIKSKLTDAMLGLRVRVEPEALR